MLCLRFTHSLTDDSSSKGEEIRKIGDDSASLRTLRFMSYVLICLRGRSNGSVLLRYPRGSFVLEEGFVRDVDRRVVVWISGWTT
ncbi:hypothetical protein F2Q69_00033909 [Brassica cretica]|uniref:Uncharacterized protein n=1 Tax=Brassica cretica TaxID=69181 RepID=A0A8S9S8X8_BRACR|nr:hypothetical protein F2Q69_00033909 [Brassica cretica]